ncbi:TauD/TfdA family dioxygenase [Streptomyces sp. NBC_00433]
MSARTGAPRFRLADPCTPFSLPIRNRPFLAGSAHPSFPERIADAGGMIPVLEADAPDDVADDLLAGAVREVVDAELPLSGGVLVRGLPLTDRPGFERLVTGLGYEGLGYRGGIAVRKNDSDVALKASEEDSRITLSPHNEMAYLPHFPRRIFFFCEAAAPSGGEVPVNDIRETAAAIPPDIKEAFRARGVRYHRTLAKESGPGATGWADTFGTTDRAELADHLAESGYAFEWGVDDVLRYHYRREAFAAHPETGEELWFNQVTELHCSYWRSHPDFAADLPARDYPATTTYGDGMPFEEDEVSFLRGALWRTTKAVRMIPGDLLVLDNQVVQHGRMAYRGTRRHYVSLSR